MTLVHVTVISSVAVFGEKWYASLVQKVNSIWQYLNVLEDYLTPPSS